MKFCKKCCALKPTDHFYRDSRNDDGKTNWCKDCIGIIAKKSKIKNKEKNRLKRHEHYLKNKDHVKAVNKKWIENNREKRRVISNLQKSKRRRRMKNSKNKITCSEWDKIKKAANGRCYYCRKKKPLTMDHVIPLAKGGNNDRTNIVPACIECNQKKSAKILTLL